MDVEQEVVCDLPAPALIERSADADLLVAGARGLGGFTSLMLGAIGDQCLHHASCPVAIVRSDIDQVRHVIGRIVVGVDGLPSAQWHRVRCVAPRRRRHPLVPIGLDLTLTEAATRSQRIVRAARSHTALLAGRIALGAVTIALLPDPCSTCAT